MMCEIYCINLSNFDISLLVTCHRNAIYDIAFPHDYSQVFATGSKDDIRLWQLETQKELLRINVPNFVCYSLCFSYDGTMIISAWNDGSVKAFTPQTGKMIFTIHKAHLKAVTAVVTVKSGNKIISGGCDAQVRIWNITPEAQRLLAILTEHAGPITHLDISTDDLYVVSSSTDGTCILWNIEKHLRKQVLMAKTMFKAVKFALDNAQILTCGSDRKIAYWETIDGSLVRELEGSDSEAINCIDVTVDGRYFVTGSSDFIVKFWDYTMGDVTHIGLKHAAVITACKLSPDGKSIVTVSADGTIIIWQCPADLNYIDINVGNVKANENKTNKTFKKSSKLKANIENIGLTYRSNETIRSVHEGDQSVIPCSCNPCQPGNNACSPKVSEVSSKVIS